MDLGLEHNLNPSNQMIIKNRAFDTVLRTSGIQRRPTTSQPQDIYIGAPPTNSSNRLNKVAKDNLHSQFKFTNY
jgi:hypothetical protein